MAHKRYDPAKVVAAVERTINNPNISLTQIAEEAGLSRALVNQARIIYLYGDELEITQFKYAARALKDIYFQVRNHLTEEQKAEVKRRFSGPRRASYMADLRSHSELWGLLHPALKNLTGLPNPKEMVEVVLRNRGREAMVSQFLETATAWLMEFEHEWASHQRQSKKDASDA